MITRPFHRDEISYSTILDFQNLIAKYENIFNSRIYFKDIGIIVRYEEILLHMGNSNIFVW